MTHWTDVPSLGALVERGAAEFGTASFIEPVEAGGTAITYRDFARGVRCLSVYLDDAGAAPGSRVALCLNNSPLAQWFFVAAIAAGRVLVPLNPGMAGPEVSYALDESDPALIIADSRLRHRFASSFAGRPCRYVGSQAEFLAAVTAPAPGPPATTADSDDAEVIFMSDATGRPKGVVLSHRSLLAGSWAIGQALAMSRGDRFLTVSPLFHTSGQLSTTLAPLWVGGTTTAVQSERALIDFWRLADGFRPQWTFVVNSQLATLLQRPPPPGRTALRGVVAGGSRFTADLIRSFESAFGIRVHQCYGLTETAGSITCEYGQDAARSVGSAGRPLPVCEVRVTAGGRAAPPGVPGVIEVAGPNLFDRYLNQPGLTAQRLHDGWLATADLGYLDDLGNLFVVDRADTMLIVGGEKLYPWEIERLAPGLPGIAEAAAVAVPHEILGAEIVLVYQAEPGAAPDPAGWKGALGQELSRFKLPRRFVEVTQLGMPALPRTGGGAVDRPAVRQAVEQMAGPRAQDATHPAG
jgi:acyl-CoA synthetase (AMP-forming)/AMP-acid ligase II